MSEIYDPNNPFNTVPKDAPYSMYYTHISSGLILKPVSLKRPGLVKYLSERGIEFSGVLDTSRCFMADEVEKCDEDAPVVKTLIAIDNAEGDGLLEAGSLESAYDSLLEGDFEDSKWATFTYPTAD